MEWKEIWQIVKTVILGVIEIVDKVISMIFNGIKGIFKK